MKDWDITNPVQAVRLNRPGPVHHIGIGRTHTGTHVVLLVQDLHTRVANAVTGECLRELVLAPSKDYQPTGAPKGPADDDNSPKTHSRGSGLSPIS